MFSKIECIGLRLNPKKLRLPRVRAAVLEDLGDSIKVKSDRHWKDWVRRMRDAADVRPDARQRFALRCIDLPGSRQHWAGIAGLPPWSWPGLMLPIAVPSRAYLDHLGRSRLGHVRITGRRLIGRAPADGCSRRR